MAIHRLSTALAALSVVGVAVLGVQAPAALAQEAPSGQSGAKCPNAAGKYPPGQCKKAGVSNGNPQRGGQMTAQSGSVFKPGSSGEYGLESTYQKLGNFVADSTGNAAVTFTVPADLSDGTHHVVFTGIDPQGKPLTMRVPFTVSGGSTTATNSNSSTLPRTGADHIPELTAAGLGLVAVGGVVVIAARRRRNEDAAPPAGLA